MGTIMYKVITVEKTFAAGAAVGSLKSFLAHSSAGELNIIKEAADSIEIEIHTLNPLIMSWAEKQLAAFV